MGRRVWDRGGSEGRSVMERIGPGAHRESEQTSAWSPVTRESGKATQEETQMAGTEAVGRGAAGRRVPGATSREHENWDQIDWKRCRRNVSRLQARIVKASEEGRWHRVRALQHLLTHSFSGRARA